MNHISIKLYNNHWNLPNFTQQYRLEHAATTLVEIELFAIQLIFQLLMNE
jgi:hypothetical protein